MMVTEQLGTFKENIYIEIGFLVVRALPILASSEKRGAKSQQIFFDGTVFVWQLHLKGRLKNNDINKITDCRAGLSTLKDAFQLL